MEEDHRGEQVAHACVWGGGAAQVRIGLLLVGLHEAKTACVRGHDGGVRDNREEMAVGGDRGVIAAQDGMSEDGDGARGVLSAFRRVEEAGVIHA